MNDKQERLLVVRRNAPDPQLQEANRQLDNEQQLENAVGFTRVLTKITESVRAAGFPVVALHRTVSSSMCSMETSPQAVLACYVFNNV